MVFMRGSVLSLSTVKKMEDIFPMYLDMYHIIDVAENRAL